VNLNGHVSAYLYFSQIFQSLEYKDLLPAFVKTFFFGFAVGIIGCYEGYNANKGTEGVGKSGQRSRGIRLAHGVHHRYDSGANHQFVPKLDRATRRMSAIEAAAVTEHAHHQDDHVVVAMEHLEKSFGDNHVLRGIDLVLKKRREPRSVGEVRNRQISTD